MEPAFPSNLSLLVHAVSFIFHYASFVFAPETTEVTYMAKEVRAKATIIQMAYCVTSSTMAETKFALPVLLSNIHASAATAANVAPITRTDLYTPVLLNKISQGTIIAITKSCII